MAKIKSEPSYTHAWNKHLKWINFHVPVTANYMLYLLLLSRVYTSPCALHPKGTFSKVVELHLSEPKMLWKWTTQPYVTYLIFQVQRSCPMKILVSYGIQQFPIHDEFPFKEVSCLRIMVCWINTTTALYSTILIQNNNLVY